MPEGHMLQLESNRPSSGDPWLRVLLILLTVIAALYLGQMVWSLVGQFFDLLLLFVMAWLISFVLRPAVDYLTRIPWLGKAGAVFIVYFALLLALAISGVALVPALVEQSRLAAEQLPSLAERFTNMVVGVTGFLRGYGIVVEQYMDQLLRPLESASGLVVPFLVGTGSVVAQVLLTIILSLYLMLDGDRIGNFLVGTIPERYRGDFIYFVSSVYKAFGGFLRGQLIQSLVYGLAVGIIMVVTGMPFAALVGVLSGLLIFIPFAGPALGVIPSVLVAITTDLGRAVIVFIATMIVNLFVVNVVQPKVLSEQIGLHPIVVLVAVLFGVRIAGPWGALFGVPVVAVIVTMVSFYQMTRSERAERVREINEPGEPAVPPGASPVEVVPAGVAEE
jgi:predicted PurR-regulated permease PerM